MAPSIQVLYPVGDDTHFDMDYYLAKHMPLVGECIGEHLESTQVTKEVAGRPDQPPAFYAIASMTFADKAAMDTAIPKMGPALAVSMLPLFYGYTVSLICMAFVKAKPAE